ncbi:MAG TPA: DUF4105 domain-containing protein, partial [Cytophagales bacterium]
MVRLLLALSLLIVSLRASLAGPAAYGPVSPTALSDQARVSVITCGPGDQIYSVFGHTALRIADPVHRIDRVYNYGTFDFNTPNFYLKFARGDLAYFLSVASFEQFVYAYQLENRSLSEQVLRLNGTQVQALYNRVEENLRPDKMYYRYQFFADNCTTRIYHLLAQSLGESLTTDTSYIRQPASYRQLFTPYLRNFPWVRVGMNIGLGAETDRKVSFEERLFLPETLETALNHSHNHAEPLVARVNPLFTPVAGAQEDASTGISPLLLLVIMAAVAAVLSLRQYRKGISAPLFDGLVFGITGLIGLVLLLLWVFSLHTPTHWNQNLLWLMPLNLPFVAGGKRWGRLGEYYAKANLLLLGALLVINPVLHLFIVEFFPVAFTLMLRFQAGGQTKSRR